MRILTLSLFLFAQLGLAALADQLLDNVLVAENEARAVLGFVLQAPRNPTATAAEADHARSALRDLISAIVSYKDALARGDGSEAAAYTTVLAREQHWHAVRHALQYTPTEHEFLVRLDNAMDVVDMDTATR